MRLRQRALPLVVIVAALATAATSAPTEDPVDDPGDGGPDGPFERSDSAAGRVAAPVPRHLVVSFNRLAVERADSMWVELRWPIGEVHDVVQVIPDDDVLEGLSLVNDQPVVLDLTSWCARRASCAVGLSLEIADEEIGPDAATITATAVATSDDEFAPAAAVKVVFDDE